MSHWGPGCESVADGTGAGGSLPDVARDRDVLSRLARFALGDADEGFELAAEAPLVRTDGEDSSRHGRDQALGPELLGQACAGRRRLERDARLAAQHPVAETRSEAAWPFRLQDLRGTAHAPEPGRVARARLIRRSGHVGDLAKT